MYIAVDFDGTCVKHKYPEVGEDIGAVPVLLDIVKNGHKLILHTMRSSHNNTLQDAINWFSDNGIQLFGVNGNKTQFRWTDSKKVYANLYIDDAALGVPLKKDDYGNVFVDWEKVREFLTSTGVIS